jgi:hypothetical protein
MVLKCFPDSVQLDGKVTEKKKGHQAVHGQGLEKKTEVRINDAGRHGRKDHDDQQEIVYTKWYLHGTKIAERMALINMKAYQSDQEIFLDD